MSGAAITAIHAQLFFPRSERRSADLGAILEVLETDERLAPRRWGPAPGVHDPYDRGEILEWANARPTGELRLCVHRHAPLPVVVTVYDGSSSLAVASLEIRGPVDGVTAAMLFDTFDRLALCRPLEFGCVDVRFADQDPATHTLPGGGVHVGAYVSWGPPTVFPRTYFGPRLLGLLGHALDGAGGVVLPRGDDVRALDLVADPWTVSPADLSRARVRIDRALRLVGILARPAGTQRTIAGPRWVAPPSPHASLR